MEIYKDLTSSASQEFEKLLNTQLSKIQIEEGKIIEGKINKITEKFVFLFVEGLKSEPVLDINELKSMGLAEKIKIGETIPVLLETNQTFSVGGAGNLALNISSINGDVVLYGSVGQDKEGFKLLELISQTNVNCNATSEDVHTNSCGCSQGARVATKKPQRTEEEHTSPSIQKLSEKNLTCEKKTKKQNVHK